MSGQGGWFRFYEHVVDDPKVQRLPDPVFRGWINLLCVASRNGGLIANDMADIAFALRTDEATAKKLVEALKRAGLLDAVQGGLQPHNWSRRQFSNAVSTERVKRFREKTKRDETRKETEDETQTETVSETLHETHETPHRAEQNRTEQSRADARARLLTICETLGRSPATDASIISKWPEELGRMIGEGFDFESHILPAAREAKARGANVKSLFYLAKRARELRDLTALKSDAEAAEARKEMFEWLEMYGCDGRWLKNSSTNGGWKDPWDIGPPPHEVGTKITEDILDRVPKAKAMRDKLAQPKAGAKAIPTISAGANP